MPLGTPPRDLIDFTLVLTSYPILKIYHRGTSAFPHFRLGGELPACREETKGWLLMMDKLHSTRNQLIVGYREVMVASGDLLNEASWVEVAKVI
jgi:hypothetical protein